MDDPCRCLFMDCENIIVLVAGCLLPGGLANNSVPLCTSSGLSAQVF